MMSENLHYCLRGDRAVRGREEVDRIYIRKVKVNPEIVLEEVFPMSQLQFALQCLELTIRDPKNENRVEELPELKHKKLKYQKWYFGHFRENRCYAAMEMLFEEIKELGSDVKPQNVQSDVEL